ncbi:Uncharacterised protein [Klebsiella pneumoniae]|nr:Uncharacterised protein [Klebsiella pneumoniae]
MVTLFQNGEAIVNGVSRCQATAFETNAAQIGIGFNDAFQRNGNDTRFGCQTCFFAFRQQGVVTQACKTQCGGR